MPRLPRYPIYIPSKGRADNLKTGKMFDAAGVPYHVVVEPSQVEAYTAAGYGDKLLILPEDKKGLVYSRNWITSHSQERGEARHWQIDDDIKMMYHLYHGFRIPIDPAIAYVIMEDFADRYENVALLSPNSTFFVPISRGRRAGRQHFPPFYLNGRCYTCILFLNSLPNRWRPPNNEDADMSLQVIADGWCTMLINAFLIDTETTMKASGGQTEGFKAGARLKMVRALEKRWPGVVKVYRRYGHPQHRIDWTRFDNVLIPKPETLETKFPTLDDYGITLVGSPSSPRLQKLIAAAQQREVPRA